MYSYCFNPRPPRGEATLYNPDRSPVLFSFNPRLRAGGDVADVVAAAIESVFQSTPPRGRRPRTPGRLSRDRSFNPRLRAGGDKIEAARADGEKAFQSTPPRGRRRPVLRRRIADVIVSIHASAREATVLGLCWSSAILLGLSWFQSTPPRGRRLADQVVPGLREHVSIHASAREATPRSCR